MRRNFQNYRHDIIARYTARMGTAGAERRTLRRRGTIARLGSRSYATYDVSPNIFGTRRWRSCRVWFLAGLFASRNRRPAAIVSHDAESCEGVCTRVKRPPPHRGASARITYIQAGLINPANLDAHLSLSPDARSNRAACARCICLNAFPRGVLLFSPPKGSFFIIHRQFDFS